MAKLKTRTKEAFEEFLKLAQKMPREELIEALPPEKIVKLVESYLYSDPKEDELRLEMHGQSEIVRKMEESMDVRNIMEKREEEFRRRVDLISRKRVVTVEEQNLIRSQVEKKVWSDENLLELKQLAFEKDASYHLENNYVAHKKAVNTIATRMASDIGILGINYCSIQLEKILDRVPAKKLKDSLEEAVETLDYIPSKAAGESSVPSNLSANTIPLPDSLKNVTATR